MFKSNAGWIFNLNSYTKNRSPTGIMVIWNLTIGGSSMECKCEKCDMEVKGLTCGKCDANEINNSNVGNDNSAFIRRSSFKYHTRGNLAKKGEMKTQRLLIANNSRYFEVISIFWLRLNALQQ